MKIEVKNAQDSIKILIVGRIGNTTSSEFREAVLNNIKPKMKTILDFSGVEYINSTGLRVLLEGIQMASNIDARILLQNVNESVSEILSITCLDNVLEFI